MTDYEYYKSAGICVTCHSEKAVKGKTKCISCLENGRISSMKYYKSHKQYIDMDKVKERTKNRRARLQLAYKEKGTCVYCGKRQALKPYKSCYICLEKRRNYPSKIKERAKKI